MAPVGKAIFEATVKLVDLVLNEADMDSQQAQSDDIHRLIRPEISEGNEDIQDALDYGREQLKKYPTNGEYYNTRYTIAVNMLKKAVTELKGGSRLRQKRKTRLNQSNKSNKSRRQRKSRRNY